MKSSHFTCHFKVHVWMIMHPKPPKLLFYAWKLSNGSISRLQSIPGAAAKKWLSTRPFIKDQPPISSNVRQITLGFSLPELWVSSSSKRCKYPPLIIQWQFLSTKNDGFSWTISWQKGNTQPAGQVFTIFHPLAWCISRNASRRWQLRESCGVKIENCCIIKAYKSLSGLKWWEKTSHFFVTSNRLNAVFIPKKLRIGCISFSLGESSSQARKQQKNTYL